MENFIQVKNISHHFGTKEVLKSVNLNVGKGEIFGLLGPSGAGKTTLIKILTGQIKQADGYASILDRDTRKLDQSIYANLGMVLDNVGLYDRLSCLDNLKLYTRIYHISNDCIENILEMVGLLDAKRCPVMKLSKGMKQRLVFARALLHEPKVLFLDEPTSGLDPSTASEIHKIILEQTRNGTSIFLTTHNMEEATKLCDNVALLHDGRIVEYGNPMQVCRKYNHQNRIKILLISGETIILDNNRTSAQHLNEYLSNEMIETIHSTEPNLETVFMELTGKELGK